MKTTPIADKTLWDSCGNYCRVTMWPYGSDVFEVYFQDFNDSVPRRYLGPLGAINSCVDRWLAEKKNQGFAEQLPSYNPEYTGGLSL